MKNKSAIIHSSFFIIHLFLLGSCKEETKTQAPATTEQSVVPVQLAKVEQTVRAEPIVASGLVADRKSTRLNSSHVD